jgi:dTMP kinase
MKLHSRIICFSGIDGTGKSTLANKLGQEISSCGYNVTYEWLRMNYLLTKPLLLFCRITGFTKRSYVNGKKISIHEFYKFPLLAKVIAMCHILDTFLTYILRIYIPLKYGKSIIICDRFIYDIFIDFAIEGKNQNIFKTTLFNLSKKMLTGSVQFLITVPDEIILNRRPDVLLFDPSFEERYNLYQSLIDRKELFVIENDTSIDEAFQKIKEKVFYD